MAADTMPIRRIADPVERELLARYANGHDTLRIAAGTGWGEDRITAVIVAVCAYDRGRAAQAVRQWDADHGTQRKARELATIDGLRARLREVEEAARRERIDADEAIKNVKASLKTAHREKAAALKQLDTLREQITAGTAELEAENRELRTRLDGVAQQADATQRQQLAELRDLRKHLADATTASRANDPASQRGDLAQLRAYASEISRQRNSLLGQLSKARAAYDEVTGRVAVDGMANADKARLDRLRELVGWASQDNGALITIAAVRAALDGDGAEL